MEAFVSEYGQLYEGLIDLYPALADGEPQPGIYQFSAMPITPDWPLAGGHSSLADLSSPSRDGFYHVGARRVSQGYRDLLLSLDPVAGGELADEVAFSLAHIRWEEASYGAPTTSVACDLPHDMAQWRARSAPMLRVLVNPLLPCHNAWTRIYEEGHGDGRGFSSLFVNPFRYLFTAQGVGVYPVSRPSWCIQQLIRPDFPIAEGCALSTRDFFGPGGALQHVASRMVVVWKPEVLLTVSTQDAVRLLGRNSMDGSGDSLELLGLKLDLSQIQVLPASNDADDDSLSLLIPSQGALQLWGVSSLTAYA